MLFSHCDVDAIVGLDNHRGVFPIHRSVRFLLVTATHGAPAGQIACRLGVDDPTVLESVGDEAADAVAVVPGARCRRRCSSGSRALASRCRTCAAPLDLAIVERAAALFPPLGSASGWSLRFGRELNATDDRSALPGRRGVACRSSTASTSSRFTSRSTPCAQHLRRRRAAPARLGRRQRPRLAYRDVASATNRLTLIAAVLPGGLRLDAHGLLPSHAAAVARSALSLRAVQQPGRELPGPPARDDACDDGDGGTAADAHRRGSSPAAAGQIAALSRQLSRRADSAAFARLNARVAELYQLSAEEFEHILGHVPA